MSASAYPSPSRSSISAMLPRICRNRPAHELCAVLRADLLVEVLALRVGGEQLEIDVGRDGEVVIDAAGVKRDLQDAALVVVAEHRDHGRADALRGHD